MWHSCAERVVFVVFVVHAVQHGVAWMLGVRVYVVVGGAIRLTASGPSRRLPPGGYPVCGAVEDGGAAAHSLGCAGDTLHDTYLRTAKIAIIHTFEVAETRARRAAIRQRQRAAFRLSRRECAVASAESRSC